MIQPHLLNASENPRRVLENIRHIIGASASEAFEREIVSNVIGLYSLGMEYYQFANELDDGHWRQKVSRLYYALYNITRALRLYSIGRYSRDSSEHKKVNDLPSDFPNKDLYFNKSGLLRDDRNTCDYDHAVEEADLLHTVDEWSAYLRDFVKDATNYFVAKGILLR